jgi:hypothetical protein
MGADISFDLDAIHNTFHMTEWPCQTYDVGTGDTEYNLPLDPLFGWINVPTPSLNEDTLLPLI